MGVHIPCTNNYDLKDWIKHEIKWVFYVMTSVCILFSSDSCFKLHSQMLLKYYSNTAFSALNFSIWIFSLKFPRICLYSGFWKSSSLYSCTSQAPQHYHPCKTTLPTLLLFLLAMWHNLMSLAASCFPFYHLRCFGYSAINFEFPIYSWFTELV